MASARYHFIYTLRYIKYSLALALLPMLRLLFQLDLDNFFIALRQDALILLAMGLLAMLMWRATSCRWSSERLEIRYGFMLSRVQSFPANAIAVLEVSRPLHCRVLGASIVTVYFRAARWPRKRKIYLSKKNAATLCEALIPLNGTPIYSHRVKGLERLSFILLSANVISTALIAFFGIRQIQNLFREQTNILRDWFVSSLFTLEQIFEIVLPAGAALVLSVLLVIAGATLFYSFLHTFNFHVRRYENVLTESCGLLALTERRIRLEAVNFCDIRTTPFSRLLRWYPVYISAGAYKGKDVPILLCRGQEDPMIRKLICGYRPPATVPLANTRPKSFWVYVWLPGSLFLLSLLFYLSASRVLPGIVPILSLFALLCFGSLLCHIEAYWREGARAAPGSGIFASYTRFFTRHTLCIFTKDVALKLRETPVSILYGRVTLRLYLPDGTHLRVRGIGRYTARHMRFSAPSDPTAPA